MLLQGCEVSSFDALPLQQCSDGQWRTLFYINDGGTVWSPGWKPVKTPSISMNAGTACYTTIKGVKNDLGRGALLCPPKIVVRGAKAKLTTGSSTKSFKLLFYGVVSLECRGRPEQSATQLKYGRGGNLGSTIYHKTEYKDRRDHYAFITPIRRYRATIPIGSPLLGLQ